MLRSRLFRRASALGAILLLTGCGHASHVMIATPAPPVATGATPVEIFVATSRSDVAAEPGEIFTSARNPSLAYADVVVSIPPDSAREVGRVQWPNTLPANPATDFATLRVEKVDRPTITQRVKEHIARSKSHSVLIFVHGFNTTFEEAVYLYAQIVHDSRAPVTPLLFTWPSAGDVLKYTYDAASSTYSRDQLEQLLEEVSQDPKVVNVSILAHSMGNWLTVEALRQMTIRNGVVSPKIKNVMMAAPDIDVDVFTSQMKVILAGKPQTDFTLFVAKNDDALLASKLLWASKAQLGSIDPLQEPYRSELKKAHLNVVDLTEIITPDSLGHTKFAESPDVVRAIGYHLASRQPLSGTGHAIIEGVGQSTDVATFTAKNVASNPVAAFAR